MKEPGADGTEPEGLRTSTVPAQGALALAGVGLLPALVVLAWPGAVWIWFVALAMGLVLMAISRGMLAEPAMLQVSRELDERLYLGVEAQVTVTVVNRSAGRLRLQVRDVPPLEMGDGELGAAFQLAEGEQRQLTYQVRAKDRGKYRFPEVWIRWWSPGRVWIRRTRYPVVSETDVYPDIRALTDVSPLMIKQLVADLGIKEQRRRGSGTEFDHIKEHTPDDGTTGIDWKATARHHKPMVRQYRVEQNHDVLIGIDTGRLMGSRVEGITKLDHAIHSALLLSRVCLVHDDRPGVMTFDSRVRSFVKPAGNRSQMERVLHSVYDLRSDFSETSFRRSLIFLDTHQRKRSLVVLLTDFVHGQADEQLLQGLFGLARRHLVLFVALRDPLLDRLTTSLPDSSDDVYGKVVAQGIEEDRRVVMFTLRNRGIHTLDLPPAQITQQLLNQYLRLRQGI